MKDPTACQNWSVEACTNCSRCKWNYAKCENCDHWKRSEQKPTSGICSRTYHACGYLYCCGSWLEKQMEQRSMNEWISVGDRLPAKQKWVLATTFEGDICQACIIGEYDGRPNWNIVPHSGNWFKSTDSVTHWMPLPEPPQTPEPPRVERGGPFYADRSTDGIIIVFRGKKSLWSFNWGMPDEKIMGAVAVLNDIWQEDHER